jgi:hypothetical protein
MCTLIGHGTLARACANGVGGFRVRKCRGRSRRLACRESRLATARDPLNMATYSARCRVPANPHGANPLAPHPGLSLRAATLATGVRG